MMRLRRNRKRRGQTIVESVLVLLVFLAILIGILDVGQVMFVHQTLVERTRAALRYGAVQPFDAQAIRSMVLYNDPDTLSSSSDDSDSNSGGSNSGGGDTDVGAGLFGLEAQHVSVTREGIGTPDDRIVVKITNYPFRFYTPFIAGAVKGKPIMGSIPYEVI